MKDIREWLDASKRPVGAVVHTLDGKQPVKAVRLEDGSWEITPEGWVHS